MSSKYMYRKGYVGEYLIKNRLIKEYGKINVLKIAISQEGSDFIVLQKGKIIKVVEVKETTKDKYYPSQKEKRQFERIRSFAKEHKIPAELYIVYRKGKGKKSEIVKKEL